MLLKVIPIKHLKDSMTKCTEKILNPIPYDVDEHKIMCNTETLNI